jgi:hypothetical protein
VRIPIEFEYEGQRYQGEFTRVMGSGLNVWHLYIHSYYIGKLQYSEETGWHFYAGKGNGMEEMGEFFGNYLSQWMDSHIMP